MPAREAEDLRRFSSASMMTRPTAQPISPAEPPVNAFAHEDAAGEGSGQERHLQSGNHLDCQLLNVEDTRKGRTIGSGCPHDDSAMLGEVVAVRQALGHCCCQAGNKREQVGPIDDRGACSGNQGLTNAAAA